MSGFAALAGDEGSASEIIQEKRRVAAEEQAQQEAREARQQERARAKFNDLKAKAGQMNWADSDEDSGYMSSPRVRAAARCPSASAASAACLRRACAPGCLGACARALRCARAPPRRPQFCPRSAAPPAILVRASLFLARAQVSREVPAHTLEELEEEMAEDDEDTDEYAAPEGPPAPAKPQEGEGEGGEQQQTAARRRATTRRRRRSTRQSRRRR